MHGIIINVCAGDLWTFLSNNARITQDNFIGVRQFVGLNRPLEKARDIN